MLIKFKTLQRYGITRWAYRKAMESGALKCAKTRIKDKYPRFWSWDVEKCFGMKSGVIDETERKIRNNGKTEVGTKNKEGGR